MAEKKEEGKNPLIENLKLVEQGAVANYLYTTRRDSTATALALGQIKRYDGNDPFKKAATAYLDADLQAFAQSGNVGAIKRSSEIFSNIYNQSFNELSLKDFSTYYSPVLDKLPEDVKKKGLEFLTGEKAGKTLNQLNDEFVSAEAVLKKSTSTQEEKEKAMEIYNKYQKFNEFKESVNENYMTGLANPTIEKSQMMRLEQAVREL